MNNKDSINIWSHNITECAILNTVKMNKLILLLWEGLFDDAWV